jgi:alginate O-acetyltransferase complex protein AlgI
MLFNSISFAVFLPIVFILYWFIVNKNLKFQNLLLLIASYYFYASWDWRFLFLLIFSTLLDFVSGIFIYNSINNLKRKFWLALTISINLGFLGVFKYYNFFTESFQSALTLLGLQVSLTTLQVVLPVGISFYTFHGLSYVIDLYYKRIVPEKNFINYSVFVSFFPLLVAGPIERATHLLPQINTNRIFNQNKASDGLRQILWGLFKKIVVADNCAILVDQIFNSYEDMNSLYLILGGVLFAFQIYGDFSGYSDIALGTARLFGIELLRNFSYPYFSRDIAEFWRKWHISLTTWFRDYLYIPLGGSRGTKYQVIRNTFIIFIVSGFWHGANWTFVFWGLFHSLLFLPLIVLNRNRTYTNLIAENRFFPSLKELLQMTITFSFIVFGWIFFRATNLSMALNYICRIFTSMSKGADLYMVGMTRTFLSIVILLMVEWMQRSKNHGLELSNIKSRFLRWFVYYILIALILEFGANSQSFIYFQF